jgi:hypothetical protein
MAKDKKGAEKFLVNVDMCVLYLKFYLKLYLIFKPQYAKKNPGHL